MERQTTETQRHAEKDFKKFFLFVSSVPLWLICCFSVNSVVKVFYYEFIKSRRANKIIRQTHRR